jgi:hypothetical protein
MLRRLTYQLRHNTVACLALFLALGGTAMAARPLITGADIQDESVKGADVDESSLSTVPDARTLGGKTPADFAASGQSCGAGDVVTGISASGSIVCSEPGDGGGTPGAQDLCDGVDDDGDGVDGEDDPIVGTVGTTTEGESGVFRCIDGNRVLVVG